MREVDFLMLETVSESTLPWSSLSEKLGMPPTCPAEVVVSFEIFEEDFGLLQLIDFGSGAHNNDDESEDEVENEDDSPESGGLPELDSEVQLELDVEIYGRSLFDDVLAFRSDRDSRGPCDSGTLFAVE